MGSKKTVFSGMRPTGRLHLGHLFGALENWVSFQDEFNCYYCIVDWHALTTDYEDSSRIRRNIKELLLDWLAVGIDPNKSVIFLQSSVSGHAELHLAFSMVTPLPWLERNPTYKEQLRQMEGRDLFTYGFLGYPVLMASDILLYKAEVVPVGEDQSAHLELTREIARRFNHFYGNVFPIPQAKFTKVSKLPGTDGRKMSKSYGNAIDIADDADTVRMKVMGMFTDPARKRKKDPGNPNICAVFMYHKIFNKDREEIEMINVECRRAGIGCVDCKKRLLRWMFEYLEPIQNRRKEYEKDEGTLNDILIEGMKKAQEVASSTIVEVKMAMGIGIGV
ncbi:MAG: tryptophan--tRNA ligase [Synergistetes bacterium]|nr:tryptophan--tRNA ligase [Synergistota bacterium]